MKLGRFDKIGREVSDLPGLWSDDDLVVCPQCEGENRTTIVHLNTSTGGRWERRPCSLCVGMGVVPASTAEKQIEAKRIRDDRKSRLVTLREEAARLGITPKQQSDREWGRES